MRALAVVATIAVGGGAAYADGPAASVDAPASEVPASDADPAAARIATANLASIEHRRGIVVGAALGPSVTIGGGTGTGGSVALRFGHVATPRTVLSIELNGSAQFHRNLNKELVANNVTSSLVLFRYWVGPSLWVSLGLGAGTYHCNQCINDAGLAVSTKRAGPASGFGAGVDLVRFRGVVLGLEIYSTAMVNRKGLVATNGMSLGLSFD